MKEFYFRDSCRLCCSHNLQLALPLKPSSLCDAYVQEKKEQISYPLDLYFCNDCGFAQINTIVNPEIIYRDYIYVTTSSLGLSKHFQGYAEEVCTQLKFANSKFVVDVGSNDGTLLSFFKAQGHRVLGIEPSAKTANDTTQKGIDTLAEFFDLALSQKITSQYGFADLITINNLFANIDDLEEFTHGVSQLLAKDGVLVIESSYLLDMIDNMVFDFIYHEHLSYFSILPLIKFFEKFGMHLINVQEVPTKGGSLRYYWAKKASKWSAGSRVQAFIEREQKASICMDTFQEFESRIKSEKDKLIDYLNSNSFDRVVGYGASATSTTLISHFELHNYLSYLVDDNPGKIGTYSPGYHIPVYDSSKLNEDKPDLVIILAWRYKDEIMKRLKELGYVNQTIIIPLPEFRTVL